MQFGDIFGGIFGLIIAGVIIIIVAGCIAYQISDLRGDYREAKEKERKKHLDPEA
ncbi:MAG: hypothetical protein RTV31_00655 [Candidatus Thorarchaeota archaeon]